MRVLYRVIGGITALTLLATGTAAGCAKCFKIHDSHFLPRITTTAVDMIHQDWRYMPGVHARSTSLHVEPMGFKIVKQDGSGGQPNPPVNLYGTHLQTTDGFAVDATLANVSGDASLQLYNAPPIITDEFRLEPASLRITETDGSLRVQLWDGSTPADVQDPQPAFSKSYPITTSSSTKLRITIASNSTAISANSQKVAELSSYHTFNSGNIWFGLDSTDGGFTVTTLHASALQDGKLHAIDTTRQTAQKNWQGLQTLAHHYRPGFDIGGAVALGPLVSDPAYEQQVASNFGIVTPENAMKAQFISPRQGAYVFGGADAIIAKAHRMGMKMHGHAIAFTEAEPHWMRNLPTNTDSERAAAKKILLSYAYTVARHFRNDLYSLDAVNEPFDAEGGTTLQHNVWYRAMGPDYIAQVFRTVHAAAPHVKLFLNENGAEQVGPRQDALFALVKRLKDQDVPIYGVGLQSHVYDFGTDEIGSDELNNIINKLAGIGVKARISEMDVTDANGTYAQAEQFRRVFLTCLQNSNCESFTQWGVNDKYDIYRNGDGSLGHGNDLLIDRTGQPTPAYLAMRAILQSLHRY